MRRDEGVPYITVRDDGVFSRVHFHMLTFLRQYGPDGGRIPLVSCRINRSVLDPGTRRILAKKVVAFPVLRWSDRSGNKTAAAIRTDMAQNTINTGGAEGALIGTDARLK